MKEQMKPQDYIVYHIKDENTFDPNSFQDIWLDQQAGIMISQGSLLEKPGTYAPRELRFYKAKGWTPSKVETWLRTHPGYSKPEPQTHISEVPQHRFIKQGKITYKERVHT